MQEWQEEQQRQGEMKNDGDKIFFTLKSTNQASYLQQWLKERSFTKWRTSFKLDKKGYRLVIFTDAEEQLVGMVRVSPLGTEELIKFLEAEIFQLQKRNQDEQAR